MPLWRREEMAFESGAVIRSALAYTTGWNNIDLLVQGGYLTITYQDQFAPPDASGFLGRLSVTISGSSANTSICTETSCSCQSMSLTRVTYRFPNWLLSRMMCLTIGVHPRGGLDAALKTPRIVPDNADIMQFAKVGDLSNARSLLKQNLASPLDVNCSWDVPVLNVSLILMLRKRAANACGADMKPQVRRPRMSYRTLQVSSRRRCGSMY